jgi:hypothetical protein
VAASKATGALAKGGAWPWSFVPEEDTDDIRLGARGLAPKET